MQENEKIVKNGVNGPEKLAQPEHSRIRRVMAVMSGKGGVGKSSVAALLAVALAGENFSVGLN